ncbi:MAG: potassium transporter TrkA [Gemmatimonadetes bacterium]|uniref:Potassium transporter TrkA n=1 Tax=Candidatus Kutchimonas denitrificans TaxID=3056748 RepID=A0AAE4ZD57_9BACT|nr:potassium transporter TrkA [Gemmatimonadota bacterium]NIR76691.1 potassium transporter TrkA [Candidatus Kutchimonas denitrificans]NIS01178.1 potassium transporter TrkA [Gemmatimonadota bacterium]NIT68217.1 potassium transporter TrkA [Gemmatimonadota bacterium]NIW75435.1 potassium transporter TrkA [Gemmatimonadota bacterium]
MLNLERDYSVGRFRIQEDSWLAEKTLSEADLGGEGILVLGIFHDDGSYIGAPRARYKIHPGDTLVLYGKSEKLDELEQRIAGRTGEAAHEKSKQEHERELHEQDIEEGEHEARREESEQTGEMTA